MNRIHVHVVTLVALAASSTAAAAPSTRLVYGRGPGAETCADEGVLRKAVAARVGYDPFFPWAPLTVTVEVTADEGRLHGRVVVVDDRGIEKGAQTLASAGASCDDLIESIALAVAVALDAEPKSAPTATPEDAPIPPSTVSPASPPPPPPGPPPPTAALPVKDVTSMPDASPVSRPRAPTLWLAPGGRASAGAWNGASFGPDLLVELRAGRFGLGAEGRFDLTTVNLTTVNGGPGLQASVERATGSILGCAHFGWLVTCAIGTFGETWARGDVEAPQTQSAPYVALGGRIGVDLPVLPKLHLLGTVDVVGITTRTEIEVDNYASTTQSNPVEASGGVALFVPIL